MLFLPDRELSYHFPRHLTRFPWMFGITSPWTSSLNLPVVLPFWAPWFLGLKDHLCPSGHAIQFCQDPSCLHVSWCYHGKIIHECSHCWLLTSCCGLRPSWLCTRIRPCPHADLLWGILSPLTPLQILPQPHFTSGASPVKVVCLSLLCVCHCPCHCHWICSGEPLIPPPPLGRLWGIAHLSVL